MSKLLITLLFLVTTTAFAGSHAIYSSERVRDNTRVVFSESAIGEYSKRSIGCNPMWVGGGIQTELGLEFMKFINLSLGHSLINSQDIDDSAENMNGFRLNGGMKLIFTSPVTNLEFGFGYMGSKYTLQDHYLVSTVQGKGPYFSVGFNYFFARAISGFLQATRINEQLVKVSGEAQESPIKSTNTDVSVGVRIHF